MEKEQFHYVSREDYEKLSPKERAFANAGFGLFRKLHDLKIDIKGADSDADTVIYNM